MAFPRLLDIQKRVARQHHLSEGGPRSMLGILLARILLALGRQEAATRSPFGVRWSATTGEAKSQADSRLFLFTGLAVQTPREYLGLSAGEIGVEKGQRLQRHR